MYPNISFVWDTAIVNLFRDDPLRGWLISIVGFVIFIAAIVLGLRRSGGFDPITYGTIFAALSGLCWYLAAILPLAWPTRPYPAAGCNIAAAAFAAGSACYLVPDDKVPIVIHALLLGLG